MGMNGIPQAFAPNNLAQKVSNLERKVEQLTSSRTYVDLERITVTEGGTIDSGVGDKLTETVKDKIVIDGGNLGEGALDGQRMVGAIIETNDAANRGVKIDDNGLRGYDADGDRYMKADETGLEMTGSISTKGKTAEATPRDIAVRLTTVTRDFFGTGAVPNPSLVFVAEDMGLGDAPGVYSPDGRSIILAAAGINNFRQIGMDAAGTWVRHDAVKIGSFYRRGTVDLAAADVNVGHSGDVFGPATNVNLVGTVKVNGSPLSDSGWKSAAYLNSWMDYGNGFGGLQYRLLNNVLYLRGTIKGGAVNSIVTNLPAGFRPVVPTGASAMEFPIVARQGTTWYSGAMYAYSSGDLRYDAPPGAWSGADRVIINASFPL